jgi:hypothetical protein
VKDWCGSALRRAALLYTLCDHTKITRLVDVRTEVQRVTPEQIVFEFRKAIREYTNAVHDTMKALHNRNDCTLANPCAYCRRRKNAEAGLLKLIGSEPKPYWMEELNALLWAADPDKPKM